ncbi:GNAT family N-acetyltransferase [Actinocorallia populi]|uniref:GNAT family N-acetyltransferase n=1 Tax=Actinocorallia populi TaxID=2079200 RepID=UPI000D093F5F|nr:GNAT family protein [Actinocorallia populi]
MDLRGEKVTLRPATGSDVPELAAIRAKPEVRRWWGGGADLESEVRAGLSDPDVEVFAILYEGRVAGAIQWYQEKDPDYRSAGLDVFIDPGIRGRGLGTDAVRTMARHLVEDHGHHRLIIDPAADNAAAIASYGKVGFRPVGVMRQYERGPDGTWHDCLLMDLLAAELT